MNYIERKSMMPRRRIIMIDDDPYIRTMIGENFCDCDYEIIDAWDGEIVLNPLDTRNKDGLETILEIRQKYLGFKVIALSGGGYSWGG